MTTDTAIDEGDANVPPLRGRQRTRTPSPASQVSLKRARVLSSQGRANPVYERHRNSQGSSRQPRTFASRETSVFASQPVAPTSHSRSAFASPPRPAHHRLRSLSISASPPPHELSDSLEYEVPDAPSVSSSKQRTTHLAAPKPPRVQSARPNAPSTTSSNIADRLATINDTVARLERDHGRKSTLLNTLKEQLAEIEAVTEELVRKVEEKNRRLAFIESIVNDLQTQAEELRAQVKTDSFKIWEELDALRGTGVTRTEGDASISAPQASRSRARRHKKVNDDGVELIGTVLKGDLHVSSRFSSRKFNCAHQSIRTVFARFFCP